MKYPLSPIAIGLALLSIASPVQADRDIIFAKGRNSTTIKDRVGDYNKTYGFRAKKGQKLSLKLDSKQDLLVTVYYYCGEEYGIPLADSVKQYTGKLPCTDRYTFDVFRPSSGTNNSKPINFSLKMKIDR
jgi:hypothetical protein